jgi:penicillin-binding protein 1A
MRVALLVFGGAFLLALVGLGWLFLYSRDLPNVSRLKDFAPTKETHLVDGCFAGPVTAVPLDHISPHLRTAVATVASGPEDDSAILRSFHELKETKSRRQSLSVQISRALFCVPSKMLDRHVKELRTAIRLDEHFSKQQLFTIYLNRLEFGECGVGVENAAQCLFHKHASELNPPEAALLAGIIASPGRYSPSRHPDRALERRNAVLGAMVADGRLSHADAESAKSARLLD